MKPESLVIANQICRGEYVLESCTHCPSSQGRREHAKPSILPRKGKMSRKLKVRKVHKVQLLYNQERGECKNSFQFLFLPNDLIDETKFHITFNFINFKLILFSS